MGFFDFLKRKQLKDYYDKPIEFNVDNVFRKSLTGLKEGDYINLWTKPEMDRIIIYGPNSVGGDGKIGDVPRKYVKIIQEHLLSEQPRNVVGFSPNNYKGEIIYISSTACQIRLNLFSPETLKKLLEEDKKQRQIQLQEEFSKKYNMRTPVEIRFNKVVIDGINIKDLQLKIFDKDFYIDRGAVLLQLLDKNNKVITDASSQASNILRVIKGHYNGQQMKISEIKEVPYSEGPYSELKVKIEPN